LKIEAYDNLVGWLKVSIVAEQQKDNGFLILYDIFFIFDISFSQSILIKFER